MKLTHPRDDLASELELVDTLVDQVAQASKPTWWDAVEDETKPLYKKHFQCRGDELVRLVRATLLLLAEAQEKNVRLFDEWQSRERAADLRRLSHRIELMHERNADPRIQRASSRRAILSNLAGRLLARKLPLDSRLASLIVELAPHEIFTTSGSANFSTAASEYLIRYAERNKAPADWQPGLKALLDHIGKWGWGAAVRSAQQGLKKLVGAETPWPMHPGQAWSEVALSDLEAMTAEEAAAWRALLGHAETCAATRPGRKWIEVTRTHIAAIGADACRERLARWLSRLGKPGRVGHSPGWTAPEDTTVPNPKDVPLLNGLLWSAAQCDQPVGVLRQVAQTCLTKVHKGYLRCQPVGKSAVRALGRMEGEDVLAALSHLELRIRSPKARKQIIKTLNEAAERAGMTQQELQETLIPDLGMREGRIRLQFDQHVAEIVAVTGRARTRWIKPDGKTVRAIPRAVKQQHPKAADEVKRTARDLETVLSAQRERLERLMRVDRQWPTDVWRQRYLDQALVHTLARRLIWTFDDRACVLRDGQWCDIEGGPVEPGEIVRLWHPLGREIDEVVKWQEALERWTVTQPFKQAHREVYLLTDAERETEVYSNRFAAHILKNPTLVGLCQRRGWVSGLFGGQTGPGLDLPVHGVRAEFWVDPAGEKYTDMGAPVYVATDQVRFYALTPEHAERFGHAGGTIDPLSLRLVPALALSEVMRDVDFFVGRASVAADPNWSDGGPDGRWRDYWHEYSFGDLDASARTREQVLRRLVPRLKIADRCSFDGSFLRVQGNARAYRIHMGSSGVLMEPNNQYLCIVPGRAAALKAADSVFLPFEGDETLSIILSKAFLLAEDTAITDRTILMQVRG